MTSIFGVNLESADNVSADIVNESLKSYLKIDGSVEMEGTLNLGVNKISNLVDPDDDDDAATKKYVDDRVRKKIRENNEDFLKTNGLTKMEGTLNMDGNKISNLADPDNDGDAVTKKYVDDTTLPKMENSRGTGYFIVSDGNGGLNELPIKAGNIWAEQAMIKHDVSRLKRLNSKVEELTSYTSEQKLIPHYVDIGFIKGEEYSDKSMRFFPADLMTSQATKITRADVFVKLKPPADNERAVQIYNQYTGGDGVSKMYLEIIIDGDMTKRELKPITNKTFSLPLNLQLSSLQTYNIGLCFTDSNAPKAILDAASLHLIHGS